MIRTRRGRRLARGAQRLDLALFDRVARGGSAPLDRAMLRLTRFANHGVLWIAAGAALASLGGPRGRAAAMRGLASLSIASAVVNLGVKFGARRHRPSIDIVPVVRRLPRHPTTWSFPSGHAASAVAFAAGASVEDPRAALPLATLAAGVASSRVYVGVHYPSDVLVGAAIGVGAAALTLRAWPRPHRLPPAPPPPADRKPTGEGLVVVSNPEAGPAVRVRDATDRLRAALPAAEIVEAGADRLSAALDTAAERADVLGVAGGDGSVATAAEAAAAAGVPLLVVPTGTWNNLARDLGLHGPDDAVNAFSAGTTVDLVLGRAGERTFINTLAAGAYPRLIDTRERLAPRMTEWPATLVSLIDALRRSEPITLTIDGVTRRVWMLWVGNGRYDPGGFVRGHRPALDDGLLDVRIVDAEHRASRARLVGAMLAGTVETSPVFERHLTTRLEIGGADATLRLAMDGETVDAPPRFTIDKAPVTVAVYASPAAVRA